MGERKDLRDLLRDTDFAQKRIIDDLASSDNEPSYNERGVAGDIRRSEGGDLVKNIFVGLLLIAIVIGSFWISFLIGKKVLVPPVKNLPTAEMPAQAPKTVSNADLANATPVQGESLDEEQPITEKEIKTVDKAAGLPKPVAIKKAAAARKLPKTAAALKKTAAKPAVKSKGGKYYKIIVGSFSSMSDAAAVSARLKQSGFPSYVKKVGALYRVQAGAFETQAKAAPTLLKLHNKGFTTTLVLE